MELKLLKKNVKGKTDRQYVCYHNKKTNEFENQKGNYSFT